MFTDGLIESNSSQLCYSFFRMELLLYFIIALILAWSVYGLFMQARSHNLVGTSAEELTSMFPELNGDDLPRLVYCYSRSCGPCRAMKPHIDELAEETGQVLKIDLSGHPSLARNLGIRAVPTTLVVQGGMIKQSLLGMQSKMKLQTLLKNHE